jgi:hypothetical protein
MDGKIRGSTFQWNWSHIQIPSESTGNVETMRRTESIMVLCYQFWPCGLCIKLGPIGARPRVRVTLTTSWSSSPRLIYPLSRQEQRGFCWLDLALATSTGDALLLNCPSPVSRTPNYVYLDWFEFSHLQLFACYLVLACSSIASWNYPSGLVDRAPQDHEQPLELVYRSLRRIILGRL